MIDVYIWLIMLVLPLVHEIFLINELHQCQVTSPPALQLYMHPAQIGLIQPHSCEGDISCLLASLWPVDGNVDSKNSQSCAEQTHP